MCVGLYGLVGTHAMTERKLIQDDDELDIVTETLEAAGVDYETEQVTVVRFDAQNTPDTVTTPDGGSVTVDSPDATDAATETTDANCGATPDVPREGSKQFGLLKAVAAHPKKAPTYDDLIPDGKDQKVRNRVSASMSSLVNRGCVERVEAVGKRENGTPIHGYKVATEGLRRELAQYDDLNGMEDLNED